VDDPEPQKNEEAPASLETPESKPYRMKEPLDQISVSQLRELVLLAQEGSISAVAHLVGRTQSAVSRSLQQLQSRFPLSPLYQVDPKGVVMMEKGLELVQLAEQTLKALAQFREQEEDQRILVRIGGGAATLHSLVIPHLAKIREIFALGGKECRLQLPNQQTDLTTEGLLAGDLDFAILRPSAVPYSHLEQLPLGRVGYVLVIRESEAKKYKIQGISELIALNYPVMTLAGEGEFKRELRIRMARSGAQLHLMDEFDFFRDIMVAVRHNTVAGIVPETELLHLTDKKNYRVLELPFMRPSDYSRDFVLGFNPRHLDSRNFSQLQVAALADLLKESLGDPLIKSYTQMRIDPTVKKRGWFLRRKRSSAADQ
jgi:DNA-binding transcriptional LysR family regulator